MSFQPCAVMPSRNHHLAAPAIVAALRALGLPVIVVDDGSDDPARGSLAALATPGDEVEVIRLPVNRGKGVAMKEGFRRAIARGFTHALQIDADGQHDTAALTQMLERARRHPDAVVVGEPIFDASMPLGRRIGRWITHVWVWIETMSVAIRDSMCGFRIYPLAPVDRVLAEERVGDRMDFDTEILVRLYWRGVGLVPVPVRVTYPEGNSSNFEMLRDNLRISRMHARLVFGMLGRLVTGAGLRNPGSASHWASLSERGMGVGLTFLAGAYRLLGRRLSRVLARTVAAYFWLTGGARRRASLDYLCRVLPRRPTWQDGLRHFAAFADTALDRFAAWTSPATLPPVEFPDEAILDLAMAQARGGLLLVAHLGNIDITRAVLRGTGSSRITVLAHTRHARRFTRLIARRNPRFAADVVEVTEIGVDTALQLRERIERGEWIAMSADRTPVSGDARTVTVPFLGAPAPFSTGPYLLAGLLHCPVYAMFCLAEDERYRVHLHKFADRIDLPRARRGEALALWASRYAALLEGYCRQAPFQWHNFYDFWRPAAAPPAG